jgi:hypothetical protein
MLFNSNEKYQLHVKGSSVLVGLIKSDEARISGKEGAPQRFMNRQQLELYSQSDHYR